MSGPHDPRAPRPEGPQTPLYMTCREVITFLLEYLDGTLTAAEEHEFERHLAVCPSCVAYLRTYRETIELERGALTEDEEAVRKLPAELFQAILAARRPE